MTPTAYFQTEYNLHALKCVAPYMKQIHEKKLQKSLKMVDRQSYKEIPAAQEELGRNGQNISRNPTSNNAINFYLLYVL